MSVAEAAEATGRGQAPRWLRAALGVGEFDPGPEFNWFGRVAFTCALVTLLAIGCGIWVFLSGPPRIDFLSFWAAGRLALAGDPALAYDYHAHRAVEMSVAHMGGPMPFPYPPPFLLVVLPFAFHPVWVAWLAWVLLSGSIYLLATRRMLPGIYALAQPAAFMNMIGGQNGFLTCSVFAAGTALLDRRPLLAGALLGLFICKPQLALLLPVAVIAGRHWRAIYGAALSSSALLLVALALFGVDSYAGFLAMGRQFAAFMADSAWRWNQFASVFGLARFYGASQPVALSLQALAAVVAAVAAWRAWAAGSDRKVPILAAATMLVSPYLFTYDTLLLVIPFAWLLRDRAHPWRVALLWLGCVATVVAALGFTPAALPNIAPLLAAAALWWLQGERSSQLRER